MFRLLSVCVLLLTTSPAFAEDVAKPVPLTAKEIAEGYILLFDGESTFGWKIDGAARIEDGMLILGKGGKKTIAYPTTQFDPPAALSFEITGDAQVATSHAIFRTPANSNKWASYQITYDGKERQIKG